MEVILQWPDDFADLKPVTVFDQALVEFFHQVIERGGKVHADRHWSLFGFSRSTRMIEFVHRGQLHRVEHCWEVWPYHNRVRQMLGPMFGIREHACVVICGIDDLRNVTNRWLEQMPLNSVQSGATFWDRMDASKPLEISPRAE